MVNETVGFTPEELKKLQEDSNVENVAAMQFSLYPLDEQNRPVGIALDRAMQPGETFQVVGLNKLYLKEFFGDRLSGGGSVRHREWDRMHCTQSHCSQRRRRRLSPEHEVHSGQCYHGGGESTHGSRDNGRL